MGIYTDADTVVSHPGYIEALQRELGLNLAILSYRGALSAEVISKDPVRGAQDPAGRISSLLSRGLDGNPISEVLPEHIQQAFSAGAGGREDELLLRQAIEALHRRDIAVWLLAGCWTGRLHFMYCPSNERVNAWYQALYRHMAVSYGADGVCLTHARFPRADGVQALFSCTCPDCAKSAAELGYDRPQMLAGLKAALARLGQLRADRLASLSDSPLGAFDFLQMLGGGQALVDWFNFRCDLLGREIGRFREAVRQAAGPGMSFCSDTYPASLSMFVGHNYTKWHEFSDCSLPLISHIEAFLTTAFAAWAGALQGRVRDLSEREALRLVYRLVGYDGLGLPESVEGLGIGTPNGDYECVPLVELETLDMRKARLYLPPDMSSYPVIMGTHWPAAIVRALIAASQETGHQGIVLQGTDSLVEYPLRR